MPLKIFGTLEPAELEAMMRSALLCTVVVVVVAAGLLLLDFSKTRGMVLPFKMRLVALLARMMGTPAAPAVAVVGLATITPGIVEA